MIITKNSMRGTQSYQTEINSQNWAGDAYRKIELDKLAKIPKGRTLHIGRGIKTIKVEQMKIPRPRRSTEGMTRITNRGTSSRLSKNKGTQFI